MGKGLSPLQHEILTAIKAQPGWLRPKVILDAIGREPTASNRVALSKALSRLCERGLVEWIQSELANPGRSYLYRWPRKAS